MVRLVKAKMLGRVIARLEPPADKHALAWWVRPFTKLHFYEWVEEEHQDRDGSWYWRVVGEREVNG